MEATPQKKLTTYQFQVDDRLKLCLATDKKEALLVFGTKDVNRVNRYVVNSALTLDLFKPHEQEYSTYDHRMIISFPSK